MQSIAYICVVLSSVMTKVRTLADIAAELNVSTSTVSRSLNDSPLISEATKKRIKKFVRQHNYQLHIGARNLRLKRTNTVAVLIPFGAESDRQLSDPFYLELLGAIASELSINDYDLLLSRANAEDDRWYQRYIMGKMVDGLIIVGRKIQDRGIAKLVEREVCFTVWGPPLADQPYLSVGTDGVSGALLAVTHLATLGRRRIAFIGGDKDETETAFRLLGYKQALAEAGLESRSELITYTQFTSESGYSAMCLLLERVPELDAVFVCSDLMATAAITALRKAGRRLPDDVAVVGYDDISLASHFNPALTTVRQQISLGGRLLASTLMAALRGEETQSTTLKAELIVRESCGGRTTEAADSGQ
jgi:DNA-binding LacI/PurR family transcriptional regulator